jgi:Domain of unknown function (DUF4214)
LSRSPLFLALAWVMTCLAVLASGLAVRLSPVEMSFAWPTSAHWSAAPSFTPVAALVLTVISAISLLLLAGSARIAHRQRPFAEILVYYPLFFAFVWYLAPSGSPGPLFYGLGSGFVLAAIFLVRHSPGPIPGPRWLYARKHRLLDAGIIITPLVAGLAMGNSPDWKAGSLSLLLYPLYSLLQLAIFLYLPLTRLRAMGVSRENSTLITAIVFSLVHWPNPLVMLVTLAGMLIWAQQFQNGRPLWQLALVMGLTATTFTQFLPDDLTRHMRVGPGYVRSEAVWHLALENSGPEKATAPAYIREIYPVTVGRPVHPKELQTWISLLDEARRSTWPYMFMVSDEYRARRSNSGQEMPPPPELHWTTWPPEWKKRVIRYSSDEFWQDSGENLPGFVTALYREILGRKASEEELILWTKNLSVGQRKRMVEVLLDHRLEYGQAVFSGMSVEDLRFPN